VEIDARLPELVQRCSRVQRIEANQNAPLQGRSDLRRSTGFEKIPQPSMAKTADHIGGL
jgi:hypothetical protein